MNWKITKIMDKKISEYFSSGCGRCSLFQTPHCKVHTWQEELLLLRSYVITTELVEELKWSQPCYTLNGKNVLILSAFKDCVFLSFLKGSLMKDPANILEFAGPNSRTGKLWKFYNADSIRENRELIIHYIQEAMEIEKSGIKTSSIDTKPKLPEELLAYFRNDSLFKKAFESLTPGRQRGYLIYFNQAKQSGTRMKRIQNSVVKIMEGKGYNEF